MVRPRARQKEDVMTTNSNHRIRRFFGSATVISLLLFGAVLLSADDIPTKLVGEWKGSYRNTDIHATFTKRSVRLDILNWGVVSGPYKLSREDELLVTPTSIDGRMQKVMPDDDFLPGRETNLGIVEFINDNSLLVNAGRMKLDRATTKSN